jgi:ATP-dependent Clp protease ATP-binding subunit ClpB
MTSNLGNELWMNKVSGDPVSGVKSSDDHDNVTRDTLTRLLQAHFRPEFLNRIDEIVVFHPLTRQHLAEIVDIQLRQVAGRLAERGFTLEVSQGAREYLAEVGYDPDFGARPLKRAIQRELQDPLALKILSGELHEGEIVQVERGEEGLTFTPVVQAEVVEE